MMAKMAPRRSNENGLEPRKRLGNRCSRPAWSQARLRLSLGADWLDQITFFRDWQSRG